MAPVSPVTAPADAPMPPARRAALRACADRLRAVVARHQARMARLAHETRALLTTDFATLPTYRRYTERVLRTRLVPYLAAHAPVAVGALPVTHDALRVLRIAAEAGNPYTRNSRRVVAALRWLLTRLDERGWLTVARFRWALQRPRDLAVQPGPTPFEDEGALVAWLGPAVRTTVLAPASPPAALRRAALTALLLDGPVLAPTAPTMLRHLQVGAYDWHRGALRIPHPEIAHLHALRRYARGCPMQIYLAAPARVLLNAYLLRRCAGARLAPPALLFPEATDGRPRRDPVVAFWRQLARTQRGAPGDEPGRLETLTTPRLMAAARLHAVNTLPPICVSILTNQLQTTPAAPAA